MIEGCGPAILVAVVMLGVPMMAIIFGIFWCIDKMAERSVRKLY